MTWSNDTASRLLALLPEDGTPRPNAELRRQLKVPDEEYWRVRNQLLEEGRVTKSAGRGGRTALAVIDDEAAKADISRVRTWMVVAVFVIATATVFAGFVYAVVSWGTDRLVWDVLALAFGGVTVAAVGVSLLIYKVQTDATSLEAEGQARILKRLEALARQAATSSADSRDILQAMGPAVVATSASEVEPEREPAPESEPEPEQQQELGGAIIRAEHGNYYMPPAIPLKVVSDLVRWWDSRGETGRWTIDRLVGGYRAFNSSGNFIGVPWVLTFNSGDGAVRSFRVAYSGRRKGASVSELTEAGVWQDVERFNG